MTGPESNVTGLTPRLTPNARLKWKVCNYSSALNITASRDEVHSISVSTENIVIEPGCRYVTVEEPPGTYQLLVSFNSSVNTDGSGFIPVKSLPGRISNLG